MKEPYPLTPGNILRISHIDVDIGAEVRNVADWSECWDIVDNKIKKTHRREYQKYSF